MNGWDLSLVASPCLKMKFVYNEKYLKSHDAVLLILEPGGNTKALAQGCMQDIFPGGA